MNKDDRGALIDLGAQFTPALFEGLDAAETEDDHLISIIGNAFAQLGANETAPVAVTNPNQPTRAQIESWLSKHNLTVSDHEVELPETNTGQRTRIYTSITRPATIDDCLGWRFDQPAGELHLVLSDGSTSVHPYKT